MPWGKRGCGRVRKGELVWFHGCEVRRMGMVLWE
jgi:hypothetical protein